MKVKWIKAIVSSRNNLVGLGVGESVADSGFVDGIGSKPQPLQLEVIEDDSHSLEHNVALAIELGLDARQ